MNTPANILDLPLQPLDLGILILLEKIEHPFVSGKDSISLPPSEIINALFVFSAPEKALDALLVSRAAFDKEAFKIARAIRPSDLPALGEKLRALLNPTPATPENSGDLTR